MFNGEKFHKLTVIANERFKEKHYWLEKLSGDLVKVTFPYDRKEPAKDKRHVETVEFKLEQALFQRLMEITDRSDYTLLVILITGLAGLMYKYTGNDDTIIGTPIVKQDMDIDIQTEYLNILLPLRHRFNPRMNFREMLITARRTFIEANENQNYPLEVLLHNLDMEYSENDNFPLFDILVLLENIQEKEYTRQVNTNMIFRFRRLEEFIAGELEFNSCLYKPTTIKGIVTHFTVFLQHALGNVDEELGEIEIISREERQDILYHFNGITLDYPREKTLHELFVGQVQRTPDIKAVVFEEEEITYGELNKRAGQLACLLRSKGIQRNQCTAVMAERSMEVMVTILAILTAGGAYLPIATKYPPERVRYVLQDSKVNILFTNEKGAKGIPDLCERLDPGDAQLYRDKGKPGRVPALVTAKDLAYTIYTSGSTGKPKGVMMEHQPVVNLVYGLKEVVYNKYKGNLNIALLAPFEFDASVQQVFAALLQGYALYILPDDTRLDGAELLRYFKKHSINISDGTPSHLRLLLEFLMGNSEGLAIKHFIIAGEALPSSVVVDLINSFADNAPGISNIYGPTETCVDSTAYNIIKEKLPEYEILPIGKPLPNEQVYILNQANQLQPPGIAGELCIGGDGLARGYLNNPELTAEKFLTQFYRSYMSHTKLQSISNM
jgi:amino acid adenylation domain-containing protein